jgi:hypothetical protein
MDPDKFAKKYSGQFANFDKIRRLCQKHSVEFVDSTLEVPSEVVLYFQKQNDAVETFQEALMDRYRRIFLPKEIYNCVEPEYEASNLKQELTGILK